MLRIEGGHVGGRTRKPEKGLILSVKIKLPPWRSGSRAGRGSGDRRCLSMKQTHLCAPWSRILKENSLSWPLQSRPSADPPPASWLVQGGRAGVSLPETWELWRGAQVPNR